MSSTKHLFALVAVSLGLVLAGSPPSAAAAVDPAGQPRQPIRWAPCAEDAAAECGTLPVPIDWSRPHGQQIEVALARRPATDPAARIGSLLVNPGGPGGSGVDFVLQAGDYFSAEIRQRFDIVGFDPRGVARSHPVVCSAELAGQAPSPDLTSQAELDAVIEYNRRLGADCRRWTGPLLEHVDTLSVVRDVDAIRAAVGDDQLSYWGVSYGTLIGQQYAATFPHRVRALALDSNMDHSLGTEGFLVTEAATTQDSFDEFVAWCERSTACVLHGQDVRALWGELMARADRGELRFPGAPDQPVSAFDLVSAFFGAFYGPDWTGIAEAIQILSSPEPPADPPVALRNPIGYLRPARSASVHPTSAHPAAHPPAEPPAPELVENPFQGVFCQDWSLPVTDFAEFDGYRQQMAAVAPDLRFSPLGVAATVACLGWPAPVNNPQRPLRVHTRTPLLLVNALHDPATGYAWAEQAARQLGRHGVLLTYEGWGHGVYGRGPCPTGATDRYLIALELPAPDSRCEAVEPPVGAGPAATGRGAATVDLTLPVRLPSWR